MRGHGVRAHEGRHEEVRAGFGPAGVGAQAGGEGVVEDVGFESGGREGGEGGLQGYRGREEGEEGAGAGVGGEVEAEG